MKRHSTNKRKTLGLPNNSSQPCTNRKSLQQGHQVLKVRQRDPIGRHISGLLNLPEDIHLPSPCVATQMANSKYKWRTTCLTCWSISSGSLCALFTLNSCHVPGLVLPTLQSFLLLLLALRCTRNTREVNWLHYAS